MSFDGEAALRLQDYAHDSPNSSGSGLSSPGDHRLLILPKFCQPALLALIVLGFPVNKSFISTFANLKKGFGAVKESAYLLKIAVPAGENTRGRRFPFLIQDIRGSLQVKPRILAESKEETLPHL
jgi:hypothetical protein